MLKIISGGQTGVDRGALDSALQLGAECGGWCPAGRLAEDGMIPERYPVVELTAGGYAERTIQNVTDSDGTLIISNGEPIGGTRETVEHCVKMQKPYLLIDCKLMPIDQAIDLAAGFVSHLSSRAKTPVRLGRRDPTGVRSRLTAEKAPGRQADLEITIVLNVAGPRASQWPEGHALTYQIISAILRRMSGQKVAN